MSPIRREHSTGLVLGANAAGIGSAYALAQRGEQLTVLDSGFLKASSLKNQKWLQSGANYREKAVALGLWHGFPEMVCMAEKFLLQRGAYFVAQDEEVLCERQHLWKEIGIPHEWVRQEEMPIHSTLGTPNCVSGLMAPDAVVNYPKLLDYMRTQLKDGGQTQIRMGATVKRLLRDGDRITGVLYEENGQQIHLTCDYCIAALGAWSPELLQDIGVTPNILPLKRWTSYIAEVSEELVERITVWVDDPGVTLVPFFGRTLIANTRRLEVHDITNAWATVEEEVDILQAQLAMAFPKLRRQALQVLEVRGCVKTEYSKDGARSQHFAIFGDDVHSVRGLVVAIPGKASSMLALGRAVASYLFGRE